MITYHCEALTLCPTGHPNCSISLHNLAITLCSCYDQSGRMEDLEEVIMYNHEALSLHPIGHPNHSPSLNNLASTVLACYGQLDTIEYLEEVITCSHEALAFHPSGHHQQTQGLLPKCFSSALVVLHSNCSGCSLHSKGISSSQCFTALL